MTKNTLEQDLLDMDLDIYNLLKKNLPQDGIHAAIYIRAEIDNNKDKGQLSGTLMGATETIGKSFLAMMEKNDVVAMAIISATMTYIANRPKHKKEFIKELANYISHE